jgi:hypothetical protein
LICFEFKYSPSTVGPNDFGTENISIK